MSAKPKLNIWNERMLQFMDHVIHTGKCSTQRQFLESIGFVPENIGQLKRGKQGFTIEHLRNASKAFGVNLNWIVGLDSDMMRKPGRKPIDQLKEALASLEASL